MTYNPSAEELAALNSMTKYPSIPTYHELDPKNGSLLEKRVEFTDDVIGTEKVDGTNARVIFLPYEDPYIIGSREQLLYGEGDLIANPSQGIVEELRPVADEISLVQPLGFGSSIVVLHLEVYGGKVGANAKQYSTQGTAGFRLFDVSIIDSSTYQMLASKPLKDISEWREGGGQQWLDEAELAKTAFRLKLSMVPRLFYRQANELPHSIEDTARFLDEFATTLVRLDDSGMGHAEGVVLRSPDRAVIVKARIQDYARTLKRKR